MRPLAGTRPVALVAPAELPGRIAAAGLRLSCDGTPRPDVVLVDLDEGTDERLDLAASAAGTILIGVARHPLSPAGRVLAREFACTLVPAGAEDSPLEVGVLDPEAAATALANAVRSTPRAAVALAGLLRVTSQVAVADGLAAESAVYSMLLAGAEFARWLASRPPHRPVPRDTRPAVVADRDGSTLHVVLDRPHRRNAFNRFMRDGLIEAFDIALADPSVEHVTLHGSGAAFCSGGDLAEFGTSSDVSAAHLIRLDRSVAARLDRCQDRVVAQVHGACIGAGIEIPSFAGRIVASSDSFFQLPELAMGLVPGAGGTVGITRRIGRWRTAYLALSGERLDARTAMDWGLIDAVDDD